MARYRGATPERLRAAAAAWLSPSARVALSVVPEGRADLALSGAGRVAVS